MQDVGEDELLVLLLVRDAEPHDRLDGPPGFAGRVEHEVDDASVDGRPVPRYLVARRPRQDAALGARMTRARGLVVRVEEPAEAGLDRRDTVRCEDERLEEPRRVRAVPLGRLAAGIDWSIWSSGDSSAARVSVRSRVSR